MHQLKHQQMALMHQLKHQQMPLIHQLKHQQTPLMHLLRLHRLVGALISGVLQMIEGSADPEYVRCNMSWGHRYADLIQEV